MKSDLNDLKKLTLDLIKNDNSKSIQEKNQGLIKKIYGEDDALEELPTEESYDVVPVNMNPSEVSTSSQIDKYQYAETIEEEETLSLLDKEIEMIRRALIRSKGKRKLAAKELGISERTLYRKIKQYDLNDITTD